MERLGRRLRRDPHLPAFRLETQNYISSQSSDDNRTVGGVDRLTLDAEPYKGKATQSIAQSFAKSIVGKPAEIVKQGGQFAEASKGQLIFEFPNNHRPGLYIATVRPDDSDTKPPVAYLGRVFNVDTAKEGSLERVGRDEIDRNVIGDYKEQIQFEGPGVSDSSLVTRMSDFSESPWLFLIFLLVLVVEQALAVHLSFHLKGNEGEVLTQVVRGS